MNRKNIIAIVAGFGLTAVPTAAFAGEGDATALRLDGVITVADCHAEDNASNCTALGVLGNEVAGSSQEGEGDSGNTGLGGEDPSGNGGLWLFGSRSSVDGDGNSESESSAVSASGGGVVEVEVLRSRANSNGDAESDGVYVNVAGNEFHVLHAESKGGKGNAAVAIIGGQGVLESGEDGGIACPLPAAPIAEANVVCASGRQAGVVDNATIGGGTVTGEAVTANSRDAAAAPPATPETPETPRTAGSPSVPNTPPNDGLARTGLDVLALLLAGLLTAGTGEAIRRRSLGNHITFA